MGQKDRGRVGGMKGGGGRGILGEECQDARVKMAEACVATQASV